MLGTRDAGRGAQDAGLCRGDSIPTVYQPSGFWKGTLLATNECLGGGMLRPGAAREWCGTPAGGGRRMRDAGRRTRDAAFLFLISHSHRRFRIRSTYGYQFATPFRGSCGELVYLM